MNWEKRFKERPELRLYLEKLAKKWLESKPLPKRMTLGKEPKEPNVRAALDRIFGGRVFYQKGKVAVEIPAELREEKHLAALAEALGFERSIVLGNAPDAAAVFQRIRLMFPEMTSVHEWIREAPDVDRLLKRNLANEQFLVHLLDTVAYLIEAKEPITLSKLGSLFFNDSKFLRSGTPRKLLGGMLNALLSWEDVPENREFALQQFRIIDNPATTTVTLLGPVSLIRKGEIDSWIERRFAQDEPVTLNSYNLHEVEAVHLPFGINTVITSENAAPFHELIYENQRAVMVYTGGYPNAAVCRLLQLLAEAGATCKHWGDTDPDGLRIAALIQRIIPTTLFRCGLADVKQLHKKLKSLTDEQKRRALQIQAQPHFPFLEEIAYTLEHGWLEQEARTNTRS